MKLNKISFALVFGTSIGSLFAAPNQSFMEAATDVVTQCDAQRAHNLMYDMHIAYLADPAYGACELDGKYSRTEITANDLNTLLRLHAVNCLGLASGRVHSYPHSDFLLSLIQKLVGHNGDGLDRKLALRYVKAVNQISTAAYRLAPKDNQYVRSFIHGWDSSLTPTRYGNFTVPDSQPEDYDFLPKSRDELMAWLNDWASGVKTVEAPSQTEEIEDRIGVVNTPAPTTTQEPSMRAVTPLTEEEELQLFQQALILTQEQSMRAVTPLTEEEELQLFLQTLKLMLLLSRTANQE